jgi:hypothetical protein
MLQLNVRRSMKPRVQANGRHRDDMLSTSAIECGAHTCRRTCTKKMSCDQDFASSCTQYSASDPELSGAGDGKRECVLPPPPPSGCVNTGSGTPSVACACPLTIAGTNSNASGPTLLRFPIETRLGRAVRAWRVPTVARRRALPRPCTSLVPRLPSALACAHSMPSRARRGTRPFPKRPRTVSTRGCSRARERVLRLDRARRRRRHACDIAAWAPARWAAVRQEVS